MKSPRRMTISSSHNSQLIYWPIEAKNMFSGTHNASCVGSPDRRVLQCNMRPANERIAGRRDDMDPCNTLLAWLYH